MSFSKLNFDNLNNIQIGKIGEYWVKLNLTLYGVDVYTTEVDDKGIDFILRVNASQYIDIQVKTIRKAKTGYVFVTKECWKDGLRDNLYLALVILENYKEPSTYLIPSTAWNNPTDLLRDRNYDSLSQKSKPEWGINLSMKNDYLLDQYSWEIRVDDFRKPASDKAQFLPEQ